MKIKVTVAHKTPIATASGPAERHFKVGEVVDLPELAAQLAIMSGKAVLAEGKKSTDPADADTKPKTRAPRGKKSTDPADADTAPAVTTAETASSSAEQPASE